MSETKILGKTAALNLNVQLIAFNHFQLLSPKLTFLKSLLAFCGRSDSRCDYTLINQMLCSLYKLSPLEVP